MKKNILLLVIFPLTVLSQNIRYVRENGNGDGSSWANASNNLQLMINASSANDEIWVSAGTYKPTRLIVDPNNENPIGRKSTFTMKSGIKLYGGFPNTGNPGLLDRNYINFPTILSGDIGLENNYTDNCFHICFFPNTVDVVFDGFELKYGFADTNTSSFVSSINNNVFDRRGAAVYIYQGSNNISNCIFYDNETIEAGGAVYVNGGENQFNNNTFSNNRGRGSGGAFYCDAGSHQLNGNLFENNLVNVSTTLSSGGAIGSLNANVLVSNNSFLNNKVQIQSTAHLAQGGAIYLRFGSHSLINNVFSNNEAFLNTEGVQYCRGGALFISQANSLIYYNQFTGNISSGPGGAIDITQGTHEILNNSFQNNQAAGNGGAVTFFGTNCSVINNIFNSNQTSNLGGAIHAEANIGNNFYVNNTFYNNNTILSNSGGAIYLDNRTDQILNNLFFNNKANNSTTSTGADIRYFNSNNSVFFNNFYQTGSSINGNLGFNYPSPGLTDPANGDFSLLPESPCINAGQNSYFLENYGTVDFLGNPRIFEGIIDMGAIEFQIPLSINHHELEKSHVSFILSPNPVRQDSKIQIQSEEVNIISVYDIVGKVHDIFQLQTGLNERILTLNPGIYFLKNQMGQIQKLVIH
jgi:hypothetical protein